MTLTEVVVGEQRALPGSTVPAIRHQMADRPIPAVAPDGASGSAAERELPELGAVATSAARGLRAGLVVLAALSLGVGLFISLGSSLQYHSAQASSFALLRGELASGTAPIRPLGPHGRALVPGTPIGLLTIPALGLNVTIAEGTSAAILIGGPGHERSTVFPGGAGTSVIMGRAAAFGGPFAHLALLRPGALITVRTGVGVERFSVVDVRRAGDKVPVLAPGTARLTLATATGHAFFPSGVVWVDADASGTALAATLPPVMSVPSDERPLGTSSAPLPWLMLWLAILAVAVIGALWAWRRRGIAHAWIVFAAPLVVIGYSIADELARLLPNLT